MTAPGPLGEEARLLVEAARDWAARTFPEVDEHLATCQWCPVCRAVAAVRAPDVADRVAGAVTTVATALAGFLDTLPPPPASEPAPSGPPPGPARQDIPLDD